jgi:hypothetical protein
LRAWAQGLSCLRTLGCVPVMTIFEAATLSLLNFSSDPHGRMLRPSSLAHSQASAQLPDGHPASAFFNIPTICSSLNRLFRMLLLLSSYDRRSYALTGLNQRGKVTMPKTSGNSRFFPIDWNVAKMSRMGNNSRVTRDEKLTKRRSQRIGFHRNLLFNGLAELDDQFLL